MEHGKRKLLLMPCEVISRNLLPAIRAALAIILVKNYKLSGYEVAKMLNLTPAAISNYLAGRRGNKYLDFILSDEESLKTIDSLARILTKSKGKQPKMRDVIRMTCGLCKKLRSKYHPEYEDIHLS